MKTTLKLVAVALMATVSLSACSYGNAEHKPSGPPRADYSARCMGNDYNGCYEEAEKKCNGTAGYRVFAKKNNTIGKEVMYSCIFK